MLLAVDVACSQGAMRVSVADAKHEPVATRSIDVSQSAGMRSHVNLVVRDDTQWAKVWETIWGDREEGSPALPQIDFRAESIVVAALGGRPSGGYRVTIDVELIAPKAVLAQVTEHQPAPGCTATAIVTYPTAVVIVPVTTTTVSFRSRTVEESCY